MFLVLLQAIFQSFSMKKCVLFKKKKRQKKSQIDVKIDEKNEGNLNEKLKVKTALAINRFFGMFYIE